MAYVVSGIFGLIGIIVILVGMGKSKLKGTVAQMSTTSIGNLVQGQYAEIKGVASCEEPLKTPDGDVPCIY